MGFVLQYDLDANVFGLPTWLQKIFFWVKNMFSKFSDTVMGFFQDASI